MNERVVSGCALLVAVLLLGGVFYGGALTHPYSGDSPAYSVANESAAVFDSIVDRYDLEPASATPIADLTPETQRAFDAATDRPPTEYDNIPDGWQHLGPVPVCDDALVACNEYEKSPSFPEKGHDAYESYGVVEADGEVYVVRTGRYTSLDYTPLVEGVARVAILGSYAVFLAVVARSRRDSRPRRTLAFAGYGGALLGVALAYPYLLQRFGIGVPISLGHFGLLAVVALVTWAVILAGVVQRYYSSH